MTGWERVPGRTGRWMLTVNGDCECSRGRDEAEPVNAVGQCECGRQVLLVSAHTETLWPAKGAGWVVDVCEPGSHQWTEVAGGEGASTATAKRQALRAVNAIFREWEQRPAGARIADQRD